MALEECVAPKGAEVVYGPQAFTLEWLGPPLSIDVRIHPFGDSAKCVEMVLDEDMIAAVITKPCRDRKHPFRQRWRLASGLVATIKSARTFSPMHETFMFNIGLSDANPSGFEHCVAVHGGPSQARPVSSSSCSGPDLSRFRFLDATCVEGRPALPRGQLPSHSPLSLQARPVRPAGRRGPRGARHEP